MATVTEALKEKVLGTEVEPQLSSQTRQNFLQHAKKDENSDEYYMTEAEFVDAIAPEGEDYVSIPCIAANGFGGRLRCLESRPSLS